MMCSGIGLTLKLSLALVAGVSLVRLGGAYQQRLDRYGEITAVLDIQQAKLLKAQNRFDLLFATGGEQRLIQEQDQWIAPNRLRVVWQPPAAPAKATENAQDPTPQRTPGPLASAQTDSATVPPNGAGGMAKPGDLGGN
jgi:hypothetical protein